jgi:hypothetical protein
LSLVCSTNRDGFVNVQRNDHAVHDQTGPCNLHVRLSVHLNLTIFHSSVVKVPIERSFGLFRSFAFRSCSIADPWGFVKRFSEEF